MSPGGCSGGEGGRRLLASPGDGKLRSPGTAPAAAARTRPRFGGRRCQALVPGGLSLPSPLDARLRVPPTARPSLGFFRSPPRPLPEPKSSRLSCLKEPEQSAHLPHPRPRPRAPAVLFPPGSPETPSFGPAPKRGPAPGTPPSDLKRLGLRLTQEW